MTAPALPLTGGRFSLFADCLLVGVLAAVAAVPVVTAYPALVAACAVLRDRVTADRSIGPRVYLSRLVEVLRTGWAGWVVPPLLLAVLALDGLAVAAGVPGRAPLVAVLVAAVAGAIVLGLRTAARWRAGARWAPVFRAALGASARDPGGAALLLFAGLAAAAIVVTVPVSALLVAGPLALAAVAVDGRTRRS
ncbi:MAG TPA: hypothetical protein VES42_12070 [Pilimelia sp.]|nr:hypothetical protein [Pilimelia sp.]